MIRCARGGASDLLRPSPSISWGWGWLFELLIGTTRARLRVGKGYKNTPSSSGEGAGGGVLPDNTDFADKPLPSIPSPEGVGRNLPLLCAFASPRETLFFLCSCGVARRA